MCLADTADKLAEVLGQPPLERPQPITEAVGLPHAKPLMQDVEIELAYTSAYGIDSSEYVICDVYGTLSTYFPETKDSPEEPVYIENFQIVTREGVDLTDVLPEPIKEAIERDVIEYCGGGK